MRKKNDNLKREINWLLEEKYKGKLTQEAKKDIESLKKGEPIDYLIGFKEFLGCKIDLSQRPLIPRPETEYWVGKVIEEIKNLKRKNLNILDIFAGSGCIGVAVLKHIRNSRMDFAEIEKKFLKQIKINLKINRINPERYRLIQSDIFQNIKGKYGLIFANPPYVAKKKIKKVQKSVLDFEPKEALFGGKEGLSLIRKFFKTAKSHLKKRGKIYLEFDSGQKEKIKKILKEYSYSNTRAAAKGEEEDLSSSTYQFFKDQYGKWRYLVTQAAAKGEEEDLSSSPTQAAAKGEEEDLSSSPIEA